jgi:predicted GNAT superfamily acetyltransferase
VTPEEDRFDQANITYDYDKYCDFVVYVDKVVVASNNIGVFIDIMKICRKLESPTETT